MPMDYDDDDISPHNFQLASEGRSRSSSVLKPYEFPKFDFGDNLQRNLRFDSLVETEVFLGIQSQEDNQWIEDYSQVSNGMEFNSTPADSCSISRRDNVWSEATSSESVEMLLKSVGQEEMIPVASIILGKDDCDDQGASARHVDSGIDLDITNSDTMVPQDEVHKDPSRYTHLEEQLQLVEMSKNVVFSGEHLQNPIQEAVCARSVLLSDEGEHDIDPADDNLPEPKACTSSQVAMLSTSEAFLQINTNVSHVSVIESGWERHVSTETGLQDITNLERNTEKYSIDISTMHGTPCLVLDSRVEIGADVLKASVDCPNPKTKEYEVIFSGIDEKNALLKASVDADDCDVKALAPSSDVEISLDSCQDGNNQHSAKFGCFTEHCTSPDLKRESSMQLMPMQNDLKSDDAQTSDSMSRTLSETPLLVVKESSMQDDLMLEDVQTSESQNITLSEKPLFVVEESSMQLIPMQVDLKSEDLETSGSQSRTLSEIPLLVVAKNKVSLERVEWINNTDVAKLNNTDVLSFNDGNGQPRKVEGYVIDSESTREGLDAHLIDNVAGGSRQMIDESLAHAHAEFSATRDAICENSEKNGNPPVYPGSMEPENVGTVATYPGPQSVGEDEAVKGKDSPHDVQNQFSGGIEADELAPLGKSNVVVAVADRLENTQGGLSVVGFSYPDKNPLEDGITKISNTHHITGGSEVEAASDFAQTPLSEVQSVKKCNEMSSKSPSAEAISSLDVENANVDKGCENSEPKGGHDAVIGGEYNQEVSLTRLRGNQELNQVTGEDNSFTFKVNAVPDTIREPGKSWSPLHDAEKCNSTIVANQSLPSCKGKTERLPSSKTPRQSTGTTVELPSLGTSKGIYERKRRRASGNKANKESAKKGSQAKCINEEKSAGLVDRGLNNSLSTPSSSPYVQFGHMQSYGNVEESSKLPLDGVHPTSNFLDVNAPALNKSTSMPPTSQQPFTDMQQVQLRAQIFVYGSLIQGTAPDEACMVSAFGQSDAGRITWDPVWRTAIERVQIQKCNSSNTSTPMHSPSGVRASDLGVQHSSHPSKMQATAVSNVSSKDTPTTLASPMITLSSPLWNISTPLRENLPSSLMHKGPVIDFPQTIAPLHPYQTPPIRSFSAHTSWPAQSCFPGPWVASPQTATCSPNARFQPVIMTETVKLTPVKDDSLPLASGVQQVKALPAVNSVGTSPMYGGVSPLRDSKMISPELHSGELKPRKRKKTMTSDHAHSASASEPQALPVVVHSLDGPRSSPVGASFPALFAPDAALVSSVAHDSTVCFTGPSKDCEFDIMKGVACSKKTPKNVVEAKTQAENASILAANAVTHCEDLWGKLAEHKESGLTLEVKTKLISAAATISAAASVAKAAAAAAEVAFNAALQAKLLADEAFLSGKPGVRIDSNANSFTDVHNIGNATPASILKGENSSTRSNSILVAAKEAAKRRVEAASAASKQAENLDAIVKAAELAASAVSQAGKIVAMGKPLPLSDIIEAGSDGYWKLGETPSELVGRSSDENKKQSVTIELKEVAVGHAKASGEDFVEKGGSRKRSRVKKCQKEELKDSTDVFMGSLDPIEEKSISGRNGEKSTRELSEFDSALSTISIRNEHENMAGTLSDEIIKESSLVEVLKRGGGLKSAWYSASVLKLEDRKAYVCYSDLSTEEGTSNLCEWVHLDGEGGKAPVIRASRPFNSLQYQGTRKRRRAALGDYAWGIGDKVDVWIDDCWWEGVVAEKSEKDETTLKVHFPAQGETLIVRAWNIRTSRSWIDGKWVECSSWKPHHSFDKSDTPQEKRQKMGSPVIVTKGKDTLYSEGKLGIRNSVESNFLPLLTSERTFDVGKNTKEASKGIARRPLRSGQQKEGSRVIFGVPKPTGKMRKFMEVGKHIPASKGDRGTETSGQVKFAKSLMPRATGSQGWKVPSINYPKEKRIVDPRPRVPTTRKSHRTLPQRDNLGSKSVGFGTDVEDSVSHSRSSSVKMTNSGFNGTDEPTEAPLASLLSHSSSAGSKKAPLSSSRSVRLDRGKLAPSGGKLSKIEEEIVHTSDNGKFVNDATEPRRSNRRFQPTHRLLEGLQSSMVIPKMHSISHDKGKRNPSRNLLARGK